MLVNIALFLLVIFFLRLYLRLRSAFLLTLYNLRLKNLPRKRSINSRRRYIQLDGFTLPLHWSSFIERSLLQRSLCVSFFRLLCFYSFLSFPSFFFFGSLLLLKIFFDQALSQRANTWLNFFVRLDNYFDVEVIA